MNKFSNVSLRWSGSGVCLCVLALSANARTTTQFCASINEAFGMATTTIDFNVTTSVTKLKLYKAYRCGVTSASTSAEVMPLHIVFDDAPIMMLNIGSCLNTNHWRRLKEKFIEASQKFGQAWHSFGTQKKFNGLNLANVSPNDNNKQKLLIFSFFAWKGIAKILNIKKL